MRIPLHNYPVKEFFLEHKKVSLPKVFVFEAKPKFPVKKMAVSALRLDLFELQERFGISSVDRLGVFIEEGRGLQMLGIGKLDLQKGVDLSCVIFENGDVRIVCNDDEYAQEFFGLLNPERFALDWDISGSWTKDTVVVTTFMGGLLGLRTGVNPLDKASKEVKDSLREALGSYQAQNWKSTVVMSRRTIEAVLKDAYRYFAKKEPVDAKRKALKLYKLIEFFENSKFIPKHWLKILDAIRLIGNIPGAHPVPILNYSFTSDDALLALTNTQAFLGMFYTKML